MVRPPLSPRNPNFLGWAGLQVLRTVAAADLNGAHVTTAAVGRPPRTGAGKYVLVTLAGGLVAFLLGPHAPLGQQLWPATLETSPAPAGAQVGLFTFIAAFEALAFGAGLAVLMFAGRPIRALFGPHHTGLATASHLALFWLLWSWWLHVALHNTSGMRPGRILFIEYAFHGSSIVAAAVVVYALTVLGSDRAHG
jgi:hypothetical protein